MSIKFLTTNLFDSATVTASSANASYPVTNIQTVFLKQSWRSTGVTAEWLKFDQGSAKAISLLTFFYNNLTTSAVVTVYAAASNLGDTAAAWAAAPYSTTISSANFNSKAGLLVPASTQTYRWWFFHVVDTTNTNGYIEIGKVCAGVPTTTTANFSENLTETVVDSSDVQFSVGQTSYAVIRNKYSQFQFLFQDITQADQLILRTLYNSVGKTEPFVVVMDSTNEPVNLTRYGIFTSDLALIWTVNLRASISLNFRELI